MRKLNPVAWSRITSDQWILNTIEFGYDIEFNAKPVQKFVKKEISFSKSEAEIVSSEVLKLLQKGAIKRVTPRDDQIYL